MEDNPNPLLLAGLQAAALRRMQGEEGRGGSSSGAGCSDREVLLVTEGEGSKSVPSRRRNAGVSASHAGAYAIGSQDGVTSISDGIGVELELAGEGPSRVTATGLLPAVLKARAKAAAGAGAGADDETAGGLTGR